MGAREKKQGRGDFSLVDLLFTFLYLVIFMLVLLKIEIIIGTIIILISLLISLFISRGPSVPKPLHKFYLYPLLGFLLSLTTIVKHFFYELSEVTVSKIESSYVILEPILLSYFYVLLFEKRKERIYIYILSLFLIFGEFLIVIQSGFKTFNHTIVAISNLVFCLYSSIYFSGLFKEVPVKKLSSDASFWIVSGIFFYAAVSLPLFPFNDYFRNSHMIEYSRVTTAAINFTIIVMHLFFIKAFLCLNMRIKA